MEEMKATVKISATTEALKSGLADAVSAVKQVEHTINGVTEEIKKLSHAQTTAVQNSSTSISSMASSIKGTIATIVASMAVQKVIEYADTWTMVTSRLKLVTTDTGNLVAVQNRLFEIAQNTRQSYEETAGLYSRVSQSTKTLGKSQEDTLKVTEAINKAIIISGSSAESAKAAIVQLGQGFASGTLRGDELNSVLEQTPRVAQMIADGMGITIGQLRQYGQDGKLTAEEVYNALLAQSDKVTEEFSKMDMTVAQSGETMVNTLQRLVGVYDKASGASSGLANMIRDLSKWIDANVESIVGVALAITQSFVVAFRMAYEHVSYLWGIVKELWNTLKSAFIPILDQLGLTMSGSVAEGTRIAMDYLQGYYNILEVGKIVIKSFMWGVAEAIQVLVLMGKIAAQVLMMDWGNIQSTWDAGIDGLKKSILAHTEDISKSINDLANGSSKKQAEAIINEAKKGAEDVKKAWEFKLPEAGNLNPAGKATPTPKDDKSSGSSLRKEYEDELAQIKLAQGAFNEFTKAQELEFWQGKLAIVATMGEKYKGLYHELNKKVAELKMEADREALNKEIDNLKFQAEIQKDNAKAKVDLYTEIFNKVAAVYATDTAQFRKALKDKMRAEEDYAKEILRIEIDALNKKKSTQLSYLEMERSDVETYAQMGFITDLEKLEQVKEIEDRKYQIKLQAKQEEYALHAGDIEKQRQINNEIEELERQHSVSMRQISNQIKATAMQPFTNMFDTLENQFGDAISKMMQGTLSFSSFVKGILPAIGSAFANMVAKMAAEWIMKHIVMEGVTKMLGLTQMTTQAAASATTVATKATEAEAVVTANAVEAASGAAASVSTIPVVGWTMSPAVFAATLGLVLGGLAMIRKSASGGYDIPSGINPVTQLHQEEMVLPAHIANPLRESLAGGGSIGGGGTNITIHAIDAKGVKQLFTEHGSALVSALKQQNRGFARA